MFETTHTGLNEGFYECYYPDPCIIMATWDSLQLGWGWEVLANFMLYELRR